MSVAGMIAWQAWVMALGVKPDDATAIVAATVDKFGQEAMFDPDRCNAIRADLYGSVQKRKASVG